MQRFKNILAVVTGNGEPPLCAKRAIELAKHNGARLKLVDVVRDFAWLRRLSAKRHAEVQKGLTAHKEKFLAPIVESARAEGVDATARVLVGKSSIELIREVLRDGHDLVIKEAKGESWLKGFFGTTGMQLLRKCPCAVWLLKPGPHERHERVMAAVDSLSTDETHAELNRKVMELATSFCEREGSKLAVVQAWDAFGESLLKSHMEKGEFDDLMKRSRLEAEKSFDDFLGAHGLSMKSPETYLLHGDPIATLPQFAEREKIDLIILGTIARTGLAGALMGNTAEGVLTKAKCSVLAIKPDGFVSPVSLED